MRTLILVCLAVSLSSCTTYKTADDLVKNPKTYKYSFTTPLNYQQAYRILAERARTCLQGSAVGNERRTEENLDTKKQLGEVKYINHNAFWGEDYFGYYTVQPSTGGKSEITVYHPTNALGHMNDQKIVEGWMNGSKSCPL